MEHSIIEMLHGVCRYLDEDVPYTENFTVCPNNGLESPFSIYQARFGLPMALPFTLPLNLICEMGA